MKFLTSLFIGFILVGEISLVFAEEQFKFLPTHSFKRPFIVGRGAIRYWAYSGATVVTDDYLRLTPEVGSKTGAIWNTQNLNEKDWDAELTFRIGGSGRLGADGIGFWYTEESGNDGPVFGSKDSWKGLLVALDTFDNDNGRNNPAVIIMLNDGTKKYNADEDGGKDLVIGSCTSSFRNANHNSRLRVRYLGSQKLLTVWIDPATDGERYDLCWEGTVDLPNGYFLGVSAATGGLSDSHDLYSFITRDLSIPINENENNNNNDEMPRRIPFGGPKQNFEQEKEQQQQQPPPQQQKPIDELLARVNRFKQPIEEAKKQENQPNPPEINPKNNENIPKPPPPPPPNPTQSQQQNPIGVVSMEQLIAKLDENNKVFGETVAYLLNSAVTYDGLKRELNGLVKTKEINDLKVEIVRELTNKIIENTRTQDTISNSLRTQIDTFKQELQKVQDRLQGMTMTVDTATKSSSYGFWIFFLIFQVLFAGSIFVFFKMRDDSNKKFS